jgi:hypothetical protein
MTPGVGAEIRPVTCGKWGIPFEPVKFRQVLIRHVEHQPPHSVARRFNDGRGSRVPASGADREPQSEVRKRPLRDERGSRAAPTKLRLVQV